MTTALSRSQLVNAIRASIPAAVLSGLPSTVHALIRNRDPLEATVAAGSILLPREERRARLLLAAVPVHVALSVSWAIVIAIVLPRKRPIVEGALAGIAIAALDLRVLGRRFPRIEALQVMPQLADHIAFGVIAAVAIARQETNQ